MRAYLTRTFTKTTPKSLYRHDEGSAGELKLFMIATDGDRSRRERMRDDHGASERNPRETWCYDSIPNQFYPTLSQCFYGLAVRTGNGSSKARAKEPHSNLRESQRTSWGRRVAVTGEEPRIKHHQPGRPEPYRTTAKISLCGWLPVYGNCPQGCGQDGKEDSKEDPNINIEALWGRNRWNTSFRGA